MTLHHLNQPSSGRVALIGAGPGDPELITLKAHRLLQSADVVLFDHLVHPSLLDLCPEEARRIDVGKIPGGKQTSQHVINGLLAKEAAQGHFVVRLKGGDPFVFGRGSEEAIYLRERGIDVEIVPGISSCIAAPSAAGIPVTHRNVTTHFSVITGMSGTDSEEELASRWKDLARAGGTLVFLMGLGRLEKIVAALLDAGLSGSTPAAMICSASFDSQTVVQATLHTLTDEVRRLELRPPATLVVGDVVALRDQISHAIPTALDRNASSGSL
jgi:uroporphyrin-III C-methyltransferase